MRAAGILASAVLAGLYVRGGPAWVLGFVLLVPWLRTLDATRSLGGALLGGVVMTVAYTAAGFGWFGHAIGRFTGTGDAVGLAVLLLGAPLLQPQFVAFAVVRHAVGRWRGPLLAALAGSAAWVATESLWPKLLGDTLGHGLYPSALMRQGAVLGGAAGLTVLLLLANESLAAAWRRHRHGLRALAPRLAAAALAPLLLAGHGTWALASRPPAGAEMLRVGMVQSAIVDYERLRREMGAGAVVRQVLDTHYAMTHDAVERQRVQAVLWSETVYPTTFARPKSEAGAELDAEIVGVVNAAGVPFVFGTYDRDEAGEYNAAAFVAPGQGLVGFYRKTRLFPLTESVPAWLDGPVLRRWLPWAGGWRAGDGARVLPLRLADGREVPALPLICLDAVDTGLALDGARLGARVILAMSNDSWFTGHPLGAELHLAVAAFRSIETRLPQFRVTSNGHSAIIDAYGQLIVGTRMGERTLVVGELPVGEPPPTPLVAWGDWVGRAATAFLLLLALAAGVHAWRAWQPRPPAMATDAAPPMPAWVAVLPPAARVAAAVLRLIERGSLLVMAIAALAGSGLWPSNPLAQLRSFAAWVLLPELAAWCLLLAYRARPLLADGQLSLVRGRHRLTLPLQDLAAVEAWRLPLPAAGAWLRLASGVRWSQGLVGVEPAALARALAAAGCAATLSAPAWLAAWSQARAATTRAWLDHPAVKFGLLSLLLALPAYRLHQHIAYGSSFGEVYSFGLPAYLKGLLLWWAAWAVGVAMAAAVLRAVIEAGTLLAAAAAPGRAVALRRGLERAGLALLYLALPAWLAWRALSG